LAREKEKKRANFEILGLIEEHPDCSDCVYKNHFLQIDFPCCKGACVKSAGILPPPFLTLPYVPFAPLPPPLTPFPAVSRRTQMPRTERAVSKRPAYFPVPPEEEEEEEEQQHQQQQQQGRRRGCGREGIVLMAALCVGA